MDAHKNFAYSTVATAPSPATSGTSLVVAAAQGALFPAVPFNATIWPVATNPTSANAEIVRVTAISTDTFTITRAQENSSARTVIVGDQIAATITAKTLTDVETPTAPTFVQAGTAATGTGAVTPTIPTNLLNDIILVFVQSGDQSVTMTTGGYTQVGPAPGSGTAAAAAANRLTVFWKRSAGAEGNPTVADSGDHTTAQVIIIRGCITTGDPFQFLSSGVKTTASTTLTATGGVTSIDNMLVIVFAAQSVSSSSAQFSGWTNSSLVSITEASDDSGTGGTGGGGVASAYGVKLTSGTVTSTTATEANSTVDAFMTIAMVPAGIYDPPTKTWVFEYVNSVGTDIAVVPTAAVMVDIVAIGGGGAGGSGIASTAAGGGGGGGGAWSRKIFKVSELTSPLQITVGSGGIGGATKSLAVGSVVKNNNGSGNTIVSSGRGVIGIDATSGSGGNGSAGGSVGSLAAVGASGQGQGGAGAGTATGGSTGAAGGKADMGGGAGGGGKNAAGTGTGGTSEYGGGGGGGGGSATNGAAGGVGGSGQTGGSNAGGNATATGILTLGGSGGGGSGTGSGGNGAVPGGGGGGGGPAANNGGNGADGAVVITWYF
jgi:hypothetical protein